MQDTHTQQRRHTKGGRHSPAMSGRTKHALAIAVGAGLGALAAAAAANVWAMPGADMWGVLAGAALGAIAGKLLVKSVDQSRADAYWQERSFDDSAVASLEPKMASREANTPLRTAARRSSLSDVAANPERARRNSRSGESSLGELAANGH